MEPAEDRPTDQLLPPPTPAAAWPDDWEAEADDEEPDELVAAEADPDPPVDPVIGCDDCSLPALVRLASDDTFDPSGTLFGTLNRVQSLT